MSNLPWCGLHDLRPDEIWRWNHYSFLWLGQQILYIHWFTHIFLVKKNTASHINLTLEHRLAKWFCYRLHILLSLCLMSLGCWYETHLNSRHFKHFTAVVCNWDCRLSSIPRVGCITGDVFWMHLSSQMKWGPFPFSVCVLHQECGSVIHTLSTFYGFSLRSFPKHFSMSSSAQKSKWGRNVLENCQMCTVKSYAQLSNAPVTFAE